MKVDFAKKYGVPALTHRERDELIDLFSGDVFQKMSTKSSEEVDKLRAAGSIGAHILDEISEFVKPGISMKDVDEIAHRLIVDKYGSEIVRLAVRHDVEHHHIEITHTDTISASYGLNEIVANAPADERVLVAGDLMGMDISVRKDGWSSDCRKSWIVGGDTSPDRMRLFSVSQLVQWHLINLIRPGIALNEVAEAAQSFVKQHGLTIIDQIPACGHSIGRQHNDGWMMPYKVCDLNDGRVLKPGMTFSVEVYVTTGSGEVEFLDNPEGTLVTADGAPACYWEHIVAVTDSGCEVLDLRAGEDASYAAQVAIGSDRSF